MARKLEVEVVGNTRDFDRAMDRAGKKTEGFGSKLGSLAKGGAIGGAIAGVGLLAIGLKTSVSAALEAEKAEARFTDAMDKVGASAKDRVAAQQAVNRVSKQAALDDEDLSDVYSKLVRTTGNVTKAQEGMALSADIARARNISLEAAAKLVEKAYMGNEQAFKKVGIEVAKGTTATEALEIAQKKFAGSAENYGKTAAGAQEKFSVAMENLQEKIGTKLLPIMAKLAAKGVELIAWAEANWPKFKAAAEPVFEAIKVVIDNLIDKIKAIYTTVAGVVELIRDIKNGRWSEVWGDIKNIAINGIGALVSAMVALPAKILAALGRAAWSGLKAIGGYIVDAIVDGLSSLARRVSSAVMGALSALFGPIQAIIDKIKWIASNIPGLGGGESKTLSGPGSSGGRTGRASGGPVRAGMAYTVGEKGPEALVMGSQSGRIIANGGRGAMGGGVIENHVHVHLDGQQLFTAIQRQAVNSVARGGAGIPGLA